ncbi:uncharacterized protein LOC112514116 [Cynara cardunculus var. scolymus]|uniref:uncharacterized protein LOC112514116 n=1 Tax=Cynara cardunculus var. scolymus TaxID=59895 RepID=UPI000D6241E6|nr:uncharacterized protein LOC112514116 [Cynara cardunculus var. scolymus]
MDARERRKFRKTVLNSSKQSVKSTSSNVEENISNYDKQLESSSKRNNIPYHNENMDPNTCSQFQHTNLPHSSSDLTITNPLSDSPNEYLDHGDESVICECCDAKLWKDEALREKKCGMKTIYSLCCLHGKVQLPKKKEMGTSYVNRFRCADSKSKYFMKNIRRNNSMFSFTSMGGKYDTSINSGNAPYIYRLNGQNYHRMGSLLPPDGRKPKFSQLYIYDTKNEVSNRHSSFSEKQEASASNSDSLDIEIIQYLKNILDAKNVLVKSCRIARDCFDCYLDVKLKLRLIGKREKDGRTYNLPTASEVAALIVGDDGGTIEKSDIIVQYQTGYLQAISELHHSYLPLQYTLLFSYGEDGYRLDIPRREQKVLRCETYDAPCNVQEQGEWDVSNIGQRVILPYSFTGRAWYMMQNYLDAMSLCKWYGYPDLFLSMTCNPKWPEVRRFVKDTCLNPEDSPDILCRLFKIKLDAFIRELKENELFGKIQAAWLALQSYMSVYCWTENWGTAHMILSALGCPSRQQPLTALKHVTGRSKIPPSL